MNFEKVPTDNLYKFLSLAGLVLLVAGIGFIYSYVYRIDKLQIELLSDLKRESINFGPLIAKKASVERKIDYVNNIAKRKFNIKSICFPDSNIPTTKFEELKSIKYEYEDLIFELECVNKEIETNKENLDLKRQSIQLEQNKIMDDSLKYYWLSVVGILLFLFGILLWYFKTQRIIDKKLKNESNYEKMFDLRYIALKDINLAFYNFQPKKIWDDMDEHEAFEHVAMNHTAISHFLSNYLKTHSAILHSEEIKLLSKLAGISNDLQFEVNVDEVTSKGVALSKILINELESICNSMKLKFDKDYN